MERQDTGPIRIVVKGSFKDIAALRQAIAESKADLKLSDPVTLKASLTDRPGMGQFEWFQVGLHFGASLAAHIAFELAKTIIKRLNDDGANLKISKE